MCQLQIDFENRNIDYDEIMDTFKKLSLKKQRIILDLFFDHTDKESKLFNIIEFNKYLGIKYEELKYSGICVYEYHYELYKKMIEVL